MVKKTLIALVLCLAVGATVAYYLYSKPRPGVEDITPAYTLTANELYTLCNQNEQQANEQFKNKVVQVTGKIDAIESTDSTMNVIIAAADMGGINCSFVEKPAAYTPTKGESITVKGRYTGFMMDVNLVDAVIVQP